VCEVVVPNLLSGVDAGNALILLNGAVGGGGLDAGNVLLALLGVIAVLLDGLLQLAHLGGQVMAESQGPLLPVVLLLLVGGVSVSQSGIGVGRVGGGQVGVVVVLVAAVALLLEDGSASGGDQTESQGANRQQGQQGQASQQQGRGVQGQVDVASGNRDGPGIDVVSLEGRGRGGHTEQDEAGHYRLHDDLFFKTVFGY